ncbi:uncharacterized protein LOC132277016 [Cornus florida]|uniref:uncharacterized protein LOC132277016 n=1 Tax=Cornus florida TaxID=4283 RepID=UPI0028962F0F|nr:uncharacterized protein LOC132277016 [Cornus florida]XP_059634688.1 uncharacterized protein LOC132277016 [Cornus florida]
MKKKRGRPSVLDLQKRILNQQKQTLITSKPNFNSNPSSRRSTRRNPNFDDGTSPSPDFIEADGDDDDERKEKKVKLVVRLPPSNQHFHQPGSSANSLSLSLNSASYASDSNADAENRAKKRRINAVGDGSGEIATDQGQKLSESMKSIHGMPMESGPTTPLPDKKLVLFILDRLQKKDTYGVFSEPVDPDELPDYHEIIEHPMDFGTVRQKLNEGLYSNLEDFEADILLICSNAMQYNAPDTVYFRQARSIHELAKRDFENLKQVSDDGEPRPIVVRRGRPPSKNLEKSVGRPPLERFGPEISSDATVATGGDNAIGSNSYNLNRGPMDALVRDFHRSRHNETYTHSLSEWNDEFPASILRAEVKHGKKQFISDENRRATYKQFHPSSFGHNPSVLTTLNGHDKQLIGVGLQYEHGYARSLAKFASNLGPAVWKIALKKIERVLPTGLKFGPGWVGVNESSQRPESLSFEKQNFLSNSCNDGRPSRPVTPSTFGLNSTGKYCSSSPGKDNMVIGVGGQILQNELAVVKNSFSDGRPSRPVTPSTPGLNSVGTYKSSSPGKDNMVIGVGGLNLQNEFAVVKTGVDGVRPTRSFQTQLKVLHPDRNGLNVGSGYSLSSQTGMTGLGRPTGQSGMEEASVPSQMFGLVSRGDNFSTLPMAENHIISEEPKLPGNSRSIHFGNVSAPGSSPDSHTPPEVGFSRKSPWQGLSPHHRPYSLPVPPDLNVRFQSPGSPSSSLGIGSPQQPD